MIFSNFSKKFYAGELPHNYFSVGFSEKKLEKILEQKWEKNFEKKILEKNGNKILEKKI